MLTKSCNACHISKPLDAFHIAKDSKDGRYSICKACKNEQTRLRKGYQTRNMTPERFWRRVDQSGDCWPWMGGKDKDGYGKTAWGKKHVRAHVLAWFLTHGVWPEHNVLHTCDNPPCCHPEHLFEGTTLDNNRDRATKGRNGNYKTAGELNVRAKLSNDEVKRMRRLHATGRYSQTELGVMFGVSRGTAARIIKRQRYGHI